MDSKTSKRKHLGKENVPVEEEGYQGLQKVETKLSSKGSSGLVEKGANGIENNETSTSLASNVKLGKSAKVKEGNKDQQEDKRLSSETSIKQSQEQSQTLQKQQRSKNAQNNQEPVTFLSKQHENSIQYDIYQMASQLIKKEQETVESQKNWKQEITKQDQENQQQHQTIKHYIIPGTMYEGQYTYVTKEKKEEGMEEELEQIEREKKELEISTEHYINPTTVVQGLVENAGKELKKEEIQKEIKIVQQNNAEQSQYTKPKIVPRINLHEFRSTEVPELHQQDIPLQNKVEQLPSNLFTDFQKSEMMPIKPLLPVPVEVNPQKDQEKLNPLYIDVPKSKDLPPQYEHYIIPGTMFEGQFTYVTKEKKEQQIEQELKYLDEEKRQLQLGTQHYIIPDTVVEGQVPKATKQLKKDSFEQKMGINLLKSRSRSAENLQDVGQSSSPLIGVKNKESKSHFSRLSSFQLQALKFTKEKDLTQGSLRFQITNEKKKKLPLKIDEQSAMTVISQHRKNKPSFVLQKDQEPNYDLQVLVLDATLNKEAQSPKNVFNAKATSLMNMNKVPGMIGDVKTKNGSPIKVFVSTKQFANFPNQITPSPPIIDETTLHDLRKKNEQQMKRTGEMVSPPPKVYASKGSDESFDYEKSRKHAEIKRSDAVFISESPIFIDDAQLRLKEKKKSMKNENKKPQLLTRIVRSLAISSLVGGFAWLGFKESKSTVLGAAAAGFALAFVAQK